MVANNKIWLLIDSRKSGGIESHIFQLAKGIDRYGKEVKVIFLKDYGAHSIHKKLKCARIPFQSLDGKISTLWQLLRKERPLVIHSHGYKAGIYGRITARLNKIPAITTYHAGENVSGKLALYDWLDRHTVFLANKALAVSDQIANRLPAKVEVVDNFICTDQLHYSRGKQIAFVGRLNYEKGADHFLDIAQQFSNLQFHLYGDGPEMTSLTNAASPNAVFHGEQQSMDNHWGKIGLLIMPSRHEGLPMAALEAMGNGIPVLAYRVGALDKLVKNNISGWLVTPGNKAALSKQLQYWLNLADREKKALKTTAREHIERHFSANNAIPKFLKIYDEAAH